jgi:aminopeptidase N
MKYLVKSLLIGSILTAFHACKTTAPISQIDEVVLLDTIEVEASNPFEDYRASEKRINDLLHTKLEVSFNWDSAFLYGKAYLRFHPHFYPTDSLILDAKGFQLHEVAMIDKIGKKSPLNYAYDNASLKIKLPKVYTAKDTYEIFIDYTAMPNKLDAEGSTAITDEKGLYFINNDGSQPNKPKQIWTQGETESSSCWFPTIDAPNEKTTQEIYITVDSIYKTLSNGALIFQTENANGTRTDYWKQSLPHAPYLFMMAIGDFAIVKDEWRGKPVHYYVEPEYKAYARDIYPNTPEMLEFFSKRLNYDYPWDKYHQVVVRDYVSGAMENTGAVIFGDFVQGDDRFLIDNAAEDVVAHELFHHWFGDLVTCESWSNLPLNESFATYGEYLWEEYKYGKDAADYKGQSDLRVYLSSARVNKEKLIRFEYGDQMEMFDAHSYHKGGRVLHMLRNYVGDEAFFASLNLYLRDNAFQSVEIHNLRLAFEEVSGEDLNWFFNQWFFKAGHPEIEVERSYDDSLKTLTVKIQQVQKGEDTPYAYKIPTSIGILTADKEYIRKEITLDERTEVLEMSFDKAPLLVNLDLDKVLLGTINQDIDREEGIHLYEVASNYVDRYTAIKLIKNSSSPEAIAIMKKAMSDPFWHIRRTAIENCKKLVANDKEATFKRLQQIAEEDEKSSVRSAALAALARYYEEETSIEFLKKHINDKSYSVISSALDAIYEKDATEGIAVAESLEKEKSASLKASIAQLYSKEGTPGKTAFYESNMSELSGFSKYPFMISYTDYIMKQDNQAILAALPVLKRESMQDESWFVRMAPVNGLIKLKKHVDEKISDLDSNIQGEEAPSNIVELKASKEKELKLQTEIVSTLKEIAAQEKNNNIKRMIENEL